MARRRRAERFYACGARVRPRAVRSTRTLGGTSHTYAATYTTKQGSAGTRGSPICRILPVRGTCGWDFHVLAIGNSALAGSSCASHSWSNHRRFRSRSGGICGSPLKRARIEMKSSRSSVFVGPNSTATETVVRQVPPNNALERTVKGSSERAAGARNNCAPAARWLGLARPAQRRR
jgi:hypothetical protein